jgi:hypothetical protein
MFVPLTENIVCYVKKVIFAESKGLFGCFSNNKHSIFFTAGPRSNTGLFLCAYTKVFKRFYTWVKIAYAQNKRFRYISLSPVFERGRESPSGVTVRIRSVSNVCQVDNSRFIWKAERLGLDCREVFRGPERFICKAKREAIITSLLRMSVRLETNGIYLNQVKIPQIFFQRCKTPVFTHKYVIK